MEITGDYVFDAPQKMVWDALLDPNVLGSILPGGQGIELIGENEYKGMLQIKVGPVQGNFQGNIKLSDIVAPDSYTMDVDGKGAPGFVKAKGSLKLEPREQQTFMTYSGTAQVGGRIASVGQRLLDSSARSIIRQSLDALNAYLQAQVAQQVVPVAAAPISSVTSSAASDSVPSSTTSANTAPAELSSPNVEPAKPVVIPSTYKPPSQLQLGLNVARDVLGDMIPAAYRPWVIGVIILIVLAIIWWLTTSR